MKISILFVFIYSILVSNPEKIQLAPNQESPVHSSFNNNIDCDSWNTNPCQSPISCNFGTAKFYPYYPTLGSEPVEYDFPIESAANCPNSNRILKSSANVLIPKVCVTHLIDGYRRFCYQPNTPEYASLFIHYNANQFLNNLESLMGPYSGVLIINPVDKTITSVSVEQANIGNANLRFGVDNNFNLGSDLYYVVMGAAQGYLIQNDWTTDDAIGGIGQYMAQSYIDAVHDGAMFGSSDEAVVLDKTCDEGPKDQVIATLLYKIENHPSYGIGREKLHRLLNISFKEFNFQSSNVFTSVAFATAFMNVAKQISVKHPTVINGTDLCGIKSVISEYFTSNCAQPVLENIVDYYIADNASDKGIQPNPSNTSEWESPAIINRQSPDGQLVNQAAIANVENTLYIEIVNNGCDTLADAVLQVYYSLSQTGLSWDEAWIENTITLDNIEILAGAKIAEIFLPAISTQTVRIPVSWTPPDIEGLNVSETKINILARIISATDVMYAAEGKDIRTNVRNNNNVAWKVLTLEK